MESSENDILGTGKISKLLLKFSIPCVTGLLIGALYNIVDQIFIGNSELGYLGNAATGVSFPVICLANAFVWCIGDGAAAYLSICAGKKDTENAHKCVGTGLMATLVSSILLAVLVIGFAFPLMRVFGASSHTIQMAVDYIRTVAAFFPVYFLGCVMNSIIRADGSPGFTMVTMLTGAIINIILDPVFIYLLHWGIKGAAWATVIGQTLSFLLTLTYFRHPKSFRLTRSSFVPDFAVLRHTVLLGASTFVNQVAIVIVTLICNITLAHYGPLSVYGKDIPISVFSIMTKVYTIVVNFTVGVVLGGQPIFGYNYGAGKMDRVKKAYNMVLVASLVVGISSSLLFIICPQIIIRLFGAGEPLYMEFAVKTFRIYLSLIVATGLVKISSIFFQAIGKPVHAVVTSLARDMVCFAPLALFLPWFFEKQQSGSGIMGLLFAAPIADAVSLLVVVGITIPFFHNLKNTER